MAGVLIVTDVRFYREGLADALARRPGLEVVGTASDSAELFARLDAVGVEIILLDVALPDAIDVVRRVADVAPEVKVVALALRETDHDVIAWGEAGLAGYVSRDRSMNELIEAVESVARGELICSPRIAAAMLRHLSVLALRAGPSPDDRPAAETLTFREREIVELIERGLSNKEIAGRLGVQLATIKTHVHHILEKLHVRRRVDVRARAARM